MKPTNYYRVRKLKEFFKQLQAGLFIHSFDDSYFQSLVIVLQVKFERCFKQQFLTGKIWLVDKLFYYNYPFHLPNIFQHKLTKYELQVRVKIFQIFSSVSIKKVIFVEEFFKSYPSVLDNKQKTNFPWKVFLVLYFFESFYNN